VLSRGNATAGIRSQYLPSDQVALEVQLIRITRRRFVLQPRQRVRRVVLVAGHAAPRHGSHGAASFDVRRTLYFVMALALLHNATQGIALELNERDLALVNPCPLQHSDLVSLEHLNTVRGILTNDVAK